jgi:hypothetical protein
MVAAGAGASSSSIINLACGGGAVFMMLLFCVCPFILLTFIVSVIFPAKFDREINRTKVGNKKIISPETRSFTI